jgi:hypothetical protein
LISLDDESWNPVTILRLGWPVIKHRDASRQGLECFILFRIMRILFILSYRQLKISALMKYTYVVMGLLSITLLISCDEETHPEIQYPATGFYGDNILMKGKTEYTARDNSLQAKSVTFPTGVWWMQGATSNNWAISKFDMTQYTQVFQSIDGGLTCDLAMQFDEGTYQIDYYENDAATPTATKTITVDY